MKFISCVILLVLVFFFYMIAFTLVTSMMHACTFSINMMHSERASDMIDENQKADADPKINIPLN